MNLIPSVVWKARRVRGLYSRVYLRPLHETFHEFLIHTVRWTFGKPWWEQQMGMAPSARHAVVRWWTDWVELTRERRDEHNLERDGVTYVGDATGTTWALLQLGYDFFCLQAHDRLPKFFIDRLRKHREFQAARYEVAVAAILTRAGFDVRFLDDRAIEEKHCEFIATHKRSGIKVGLEAKSRVRRGALHEPGEFAYSEDARGIEKLVRKARKQKPEGMPLLIFVDVNLPPEHDVPGEDRSWVRDIKAMIDRLGGNRPDNPDPFAALFVTNFSCYYGWPDGKSYKGEWSMVLPNYTQERFPMPLLKLIYDTVSRYDTIPDEI